MRKFVVWLLLSLALLAILAWSVPALLRAMPSRYVARLPEPLQELGAPAIDSPVLPTLASPIDTDRLLAAATPAVEPTMPPTFTPIPSTTPIAAATMPPTLQPSPTPPPSPTPTPTATAVPLPVSARIGDLRHKFQTWNNCGPATLAMTLSYFDLHLSQEETAAVLKPDPEDRNVSPHEMAAYVNELTPYQALYRVNGTRETIRRLIANDIPVIVEIGIDPPGEFRWLGWYGHYLSMVAYDDELAQFWVYDSWFGTSEEPLKNAHADGRVLPYADFDTYWPHFDRSC